MLTLKLNRNQFRILGVA